MAAKQKKPTVRARKAGVLPKEATPESPLLPTPARALSRVAADSAPPATLAHLAFLPHVLEDGSLLRFPGVDPGIYDGPIKYKIETTLQEALAEVMKKSPFSAMQVTLVDLSSDPHAPEFAGYQHKGMTAIASIAKLIPMTAAFQLQADLRALQASGGFATRAALFGEVRRLWRATQTPAAGEPVVTVSDQLGRQGDLATWKGKPIKLPAKAAVLPNLEVIFQDDLTLDFATTRIGLSDALCDEHIGLEQLERARPKLTDAAWVPFLQRMKLMVGFSDNEAAASCIRDLGFPYLTSVMIQMGLWDPARGGGLWLGANYGSVPLLASPTAPMGHNGNAGSLAALMTLLAQGALVSSAASVEMQSLLNKDRYPSHFTRSGFGAGLRRRFTDVTVFSKLGLLGGKEFDCALIERSHHGNSLRYVAVGLNAPGTQAMVDLIVKLDEAIRINNGL